MVAVPTPPLRAFCRGSAQIGANQSFETREEAEEWLGQAWPELEEIGVEAVTLLSNDETVYGPMPLSQG